MNNQFASRLLTLGCVVTMASTSIALAQSQKPAAKFVDADTIVGANIENAKGEDIADVNDLVFDRRDGRILLAIVGTGGVLGMGEKDIAVPYGALAWNGTKKTYTLNATEEQLKSLPEFKTDDLSNLSQAEWSSSMRSVFGDRVEWNGADERDGRDAYAWVFASRTPQPVSGRVVAIEKECKMCDGHNAYCVMIEDDKGITRPVVLAPTWYVTEEETLMFEEGDPVKVQTVRAVDATGETVYLASTIERNGKQTHLRDRSGVPQWAKSTVKQNERGWPTLQLISKATGQKVYAHGTEFGKIKDLMVEVNSGTIAYAVVTSGGVIGIGNTLYPVPFAAIAPIGTERAYVNLSEAEMKAAPALSDKGVEDLGNEAYSNRVLEFYGARRTPYDTDRSSNWSAGKTASAGR